MNNNEEYRNNGNMQSQMNGGSSHKKNQDIRFFGNFSDQKTPTNEHPSFLYRANANLNDINAKDGKQNHPANFGNLSNMILEEKYL